VPSCLSQYVGDAFKEAGAPVYFCVEDREDTMANWASLDKAHILQIHRRSIFIRSFIQHFYDLRQADLPH